MSTIFVDNIQTVRITKHTLSKQKYLLIELLECQKRSNAQHLTLVVSLTPQWVLEDQTYENKGAADSQAAPIMLKDQAD